MEPTPEHTAARLNLDKRAVLSRRSGTLLPRHLGRAAWNLQLDGLIRALVGIGDRRLWRVTLTDTGRAVKVALGALVDEEEGWGILLVGRGEDCWWKPERNGYALDVSRAGLYSRDEAISIHGRRYAGGEGPADVAVPPARMRDLMDAALAKAREGVARLEQARNAASAEAAP